MTMTSTDITFSFSLASGEGRILGGGWDIRYQGYDSALSAWMAANRDGFLLAPEATFGLHHTPTPVIR